MFCDNFPLKKSNGENGVHARTCVTRDTAVSYQNTKRKSTNKKDLKNKQNLEPHIIQLASGNGYSEKN